MDEKTERPDRTTPVSIHDEMKKSYLDYAMSVIIGRALPDVRDGLKPVHRRVLYAMHDMGNDHAKPYKKAARIVGDVIGKYHPHGEMSVYDAVVRMAQDFSLRHPLVDGQGNFGSIDGDPPAAMRYTEVRMSRLAGEMLKDLEKETVDWVANYDGSLEEPLVLPSAIPNLLANGSDGIAVGMATKIPPHNLGELVDALILTIEQPESQLGDIMKLLPGPDFPTAGFIHGTEGIRQAYATGRGAISMRGRAEIEEATRKGALRIVITEIPYQVNKVRLIEQIADLVRSKRVEGIADIRDESSREGMRLVLELKKDEAPQPILNFLYKHTQLQDSFGCILLAIVGGQPKVLTLREMLDAFVAHRREIVLRRTAFELRKAEERAHILEGLKIALDHLDEVIATIRAARDPQTAKEQLRFKFKLSDLQAQAILEMRLQRLTGLERDKIIQEYEDTLREIARLMGILGSEQKVREIIVEELRKVRATYANERRTEIVPFVDEILLEDMIKEEDMVVTVSHTGYIKRSPLDIYRTQRRGGKGRVGMTTRDEDFVEHLFIASTHASLLIFTSKGKVHRVKVFELPEVGASAKGKALVNFVNLAAEEKVMALVAIKEFELKTYVVMATAKGVIKKTPLTDFQNIRTGGIIALTIDAGDDLLGARLSDGTQDIILATHGGKIIRFHEDDVRDMGRAARGVRGIKLREKDYVVEMDTLAGATHIMTVTENGYGKRTEIAKYRKQTRGGYGIIDIRTTPRNGTVVGVKAVKDDDQIMLITVQGMIMRMRVKQTSVVGRATQGVRLISVEGGDKLVSVAKLAEK
ncbi:MAG: DNA gyrase subunit A, partial [Acidobacteria bacterium]|nr:DNA gyrase subunit A [Acidobacteriota bacterium]